MVMEDLGGGSVSEAVSENIVTMMDVKNRDVTSIKVNMNVGMGIRGVGGGVTFRQEGCVIACDHNNGLPTFLKPSFTPRPVGVGVKLWHSQANMDENSAGATLTTTKL